MKRLKQQFLCAVAAGAVLATAALPVCAAAEYTELTAYSDYLQTAEAVYPEQEITVDSRHLTADSVGCTVQEYQGREAVLTTDDSRAVFTVAADSAGLYTMEVTYCGVENKKADMLRSIAINGAIPFDEASSVSFVRTYTNETDEFTVDAQGNQVRPQQIEVLRWQSLPVYGNSGYSGDPLLFHLDAGVNTVELAALAEPMAIAQIRFFKRTGELSYAAYRETHASQGNGGAAIRIQGEGATYKSDYSMVPLSVTGSADMDPVSLGETRYNAIGGSNWSAVGGTITWEFTVERAGDYQISMRLLQGGSSGSVSSRDILIDGQIPFAELKGYAYPYAGDWHTVVLGNEDGAFVFPLEAGTHTLTMRVSLGGLGIILEELEQEMTALNGVYRQLLVIMGTDPDTYRDYQFQLYIPEVIDQLKTHAETLGRLGESLQSYLGTKTGDTQFLERFSEQLLEMYEKESAIAKQYSSFQNNISTLADYIAGAKSQPLTVDYIEFTPAGKPVADGKTGFFSGLLFGLKRFFLSFVSDYNAVTGDGSERVTVWVGTGRDQSQIIKTLAKNDFTVQTGISVDLKLVPMSALLPAALADNSPDVALSISSTDIANYAFRGAVVRLDDFDGIGEIKSRFSASALEPLTYEDGVYALPETQTFYVLFYRKDILRMLGLEVPQTWRQVFEILPVLQKNNMTIGLPANRMHHLTMMMNQSGTDLYNAAHTATQIDSDSAIEAFSTITDMFSDYEVPQTINFVSRFRTGSVPIGIAEYTTYNTLEVSAPELSGTWGFSAVPGTEGADGQINNSSVGVTTGCILMNKGKNHQNGFRFMDWWTSAAVQAEYGRQIENELGSSARYASANMEAVSQLPWKKTDYDTLLTLWKNVRGIPEVPGGYYMSREINFAFSGVVNNHKDVSEELTDAAVEINKEITAKRKEFNMTSGKE